VVEAVVEVVVVVEVPVQKVEAVVEVVQEKLPVESLQVLSLPERVPLDQRVELCPIRNPHIWDELYTDSQLGLISRNIDGIPFT
jgi:hypothetical protein